MYQNNFLKSGEIFFSTSPSSIMTILGSCIAFCVYDHRLKIGGMAHYLLPSRNKNQNVLHENQFGEYAIPNLLKFFKNNGSKKSDLLVTVLGGGHNSTEGSMAVAQANINCAYHWIKKLKLKLQIEKTFTNGGVKILMNTFSGEIFISKNADLKKSVIEKATKFDLIAIGASTGGTEAIRYLSRFMDQNLPPIVIVQHMPSSFTQTFAESLNLHSDIRFSEAVNGEILQRGKAYIAPGGKQMKIILGPIGPKIEINDDPEVNLFKPSVDYLFTSLVKLVRHQKILALILTGMGSDGAKGLLSLHKLGVSTIAQDEKSSIVFGMPKAAIDLQAIDRILGLNDMAHLFKK